MRKLQISLAVWLLTAGTVLAAMKVEVARSQSVDYSAYASFGFKAKEGVPPEHPLGEESALLTRARDAAKKALLARGMTYVDGERPDLWITFFGLGREDLTIEGTSRDLGPVTWVGAPGAHSSRTVIEGTLIVELWDASSDKRIWSGWATELSASREKLRARVDKATRKILREFPRE